MNKDKQYYLDLAERWFDAETSEAEEKELKRFLAATEDPDFDEARAALGFLAASSLRAEAPKSPIDLPRQIGPRRTAGLLGTSATTASLGALPPLWRWFRSVMAAAFPMCTASR